MTDSSEDIAKYRMMANDGWIHAMYVLASTLLISANSCDRGDEAAKWLFMAAYFGHERSKSALEFVNSALGPERFNKAADEGIAWLQQKIDEYDAHKDISKWSSELYEIAKKNEKDWERRAALKLVWRNDQ